MSEEQVNAASDESPRSDEGSDGVVSEKSPTQMLQDLTGLTTFMNQQLTQVRGAVQQLYDAVGAQCRQLLESDTTLQGELQRFRTAGADQLMAGLLHKLFEDLIRQMNELDDMVALGASTERPDGEMAWVESIRIHRDQFETILMKWGCRPIDIEVGRDEFDPDFQEAAEAQPGDIPEGMAENIIAKVRRRGWRFQDIPLQHPIVVVS